MKSARKSLFLFLSTYAVGLLFPSFSEGRRISRSTETAERETAVDTVLVGRFRIKTDGPRGASLQSGIGDFQSLMAQYLETRTYWTTRQIDTELTLGADNNDVKALSSESQFTAVLLGEFRNRYLRMRLRRVSTGRALISWTVPLPPRLDKESMKALVKDVVDEIVSSLPYRGFVIARKGRQIKINLGKAQALKKGEDLEIFEFEGRNFGREREHLADVTVVKIAPEAAIAEVPEDVQIPLYSKVGFRDLKSTNFPDIDEKYFRSFWLGAGGDMLFVDTQASDTTPELQQRVYQLTLSPFMTVAGGYGAISVRASVGGAENASSKVSFLFVDGGYEFLRRSNEKFGFVTSLGLGLQKYTASNKPGAEFPLTSSQAYWPYIEQLLVYSLSNRSRISVGGQLQIPKFSSDSLNGSSQAIGSFGFQTQLALRLLFADDFGVENGITYQYSQFRLQDGQGVAEAIFGINFKTLYKF